jgi:hypothetical protein
MGTWLKTDSRELCTMDSVGVCVRQAVHFVLCLSRRMALHSSGGMESNSIARASGDGEQHAKFRPSSSASGGTEFLYLESDCRNCR